MTESTPIVDTSGFTCPSCGVPLHCTDADLMECTVEGTSYRKMGGIWNLTSPDRLIRFDAFVRDYDHVRDREGRGSDDVAYFRGLPYQDETGRYGRDWRIRAGSFDCFVQRMLLPMEGRKLRILDLGAGNGWFSYRMAQRGHEAFAVDLRTGPRDGLGAHVHYDVPFVPVRAEFDRLPFESGTFDLAVFNASFHYSERFEDTLREAIRVLSPRGQVVVIDTPIYKDPQSGERMVQERAAHFKARHGCASDAISSENYLTEQRLRQLAVRVGVTWTMHRPRYGLRWEARRAVSRIRNRREPARFCVLSGSLKLDVPAELRRTKPLRGRQAIGRFGLRMRFVAGQRWRLDRPMSENVAGIRLHIPPGVFNPVIFRTGKFLVEVLTENVLPQNASVLDLGTGSGVCAIAAARCGADVTAVDVGREAVETARENARRNGVKLRVLESDLFGDLGRFDAILLNPPFYAGEPGTPFERAWRSDSFIERFSAELPSHLRDGGFALVILSSDGRCPEYLRRFDADGHRITRVAERRFMNETLTIYRLG